MLLNLANASEFMLVAARRKMCVKTYQVLGRKFSPYESPVLDQKKGVVYEAFYGETFETKKIVCLNVETGECRYIDFPYDGTPGREGRINAEGDYCFIHVRLDNGRPYVEIGYLKDGMFSFRSFKNLVYGRSSFWTEKFMILPRNKLLWLDTEKEMELNIPPQKQGSIRAGIFFEETRNCFWHIQTVSA